MLKRQGRQNFQQDNITVVSYVEDLGDIYVALLYVEFVSVNLLGKASSRELRRRVGKKLLLTIGWRGLHYVIK